MMIFRVSQISGATSENQLRFTDLSGFLRKKTEDQPTMIAGFGKVKSSHQAECPLFVKMKWLFHQLLWGFLIKSYHFTHIKNPQAGKRLYNIQSRTTWRKKIKRISSKFPPYHKNSKLKYYTPNQWLFLLPVKGGRWHIIP